MTAAALGSATRPVRSLMDAVIHQGFLDNIEPGERRYHLHDSVHALRDAARWSGAADLDRLE